MRQYELNFKRMWNIITLNQVTISMCYLAKDSLLFSSSSKSFLNFRLSSTRCLIKWFLIKKMCNAKILSPRKLLKDPFRVSKALGPESCPNFILRRLRLCSTLQPQLRGSRYATAWIQLHHLSQFVDSIFLKHEKLQCLKLLFVSLFAFLLLNLHKLMFQICSKFW